MSSARTRRRRALATVALAVLIVAVPLGIYAWGRTSGTFRVRHIELDGARPAHARAVRLALKRRLLGVNLFGVSTARVRAALAAFPYVAELTIDRDFPDTLRVRMTEYVPAALVVSGGRWYVVASAGRVLAVAAGTSGTSASAGSSPVSGASPSASSSSSSGGQATTTSPSPGTSGSPAPSAGDTKSSKSPTPAATSLPSPPPAVKLPHGTRSLPVVVTSVPLTVGATITDTRVRAALSVLAALPRALRRSTLGARATATSIRVVVSGGPTIEFGDTSRLAAKVLALRLVLARYRQHHTACTFVDVSVPDRPLGAPLLPAPAVQTSSAPGSATSGAAAGASKSPSPTASGTP